MRFRRFSYSRRTKKSYVKVWMDIRCVECGRFVRKKHFNPRKPLCSPCSEERKRYKSVKERVIRNLGKERLLYGKCITV